MVLITVRVKWFYCFRIVSDKQKIVKTKSSNEPGRIIVQEQKSVALPPVKNAVDKSDNKKDAIVTKEKIDQQQILSENIKNITLRNEQLYQLEKTLKNNFENLKGYSKNSSRQSGLDTGPDEEETDDFGPLKLPLTNRTILKEANPELLKLQGIIYLVIFPDQNYKLVLFYRRNHKYG